MKQVFTLNQVEIDFVGGMTEQFPEFKDVIRASAYSCGKPFKSVAADLDMSVSELSRKLNENPHDPVHFPLHRLPDLIRATGDKRPIYWLIESFIEDKSAKRARAMDELSGLLPHIAQLLKSAKDVA